MVEPVGIADKSDRRDSQMSEGEIFEQIMVALENPKRQLECMRRSLGNELWQIKVAIAREEKYPPIQRR